jgi:hypothetical protein
MPCNHGPNGTLGGNHHFAVMISPLGECRLLSNIVLAAWPAQSAGWGELPQAGRRPGVIPPGAQCAALLLQCSAESSVAMRL